MQITETELEAIEDILIEVKNFYHGLDEPLDDEIKKVEAIVKRLRLEQVQKPDEWLIKMLNLANESSAEIAAIGEWITDYETGNRMWVGDETAMFLASARGIVLELVRRCGLDHNRSG